jgi:prophage antirepressor-like protein
MRVLEIKNISDAADRLDDDEKSGVAINDPHGRPQNTTVISESGLYSLVLTSRKPEAKRFKKWVTADVLPTIRKTGSYAAPVPLTREQQLAVALRLADDTIQEMTEASEEFAAIGRPSFGKP